MSQVVEEYDSWHRQLAAEETPEATAPWHQMVKPHLGDIAGLRVLEIGCGRGAFALYLAGRGARVVAADFSPAAVEIASGLLDGRASAIVADVQQLPFEDGHFDLVISLETLEHVPDPARGLSELVRVTRPGGRLIVTTPNYLNAVGAWRILRRLTPGVSSYTEIGQPINKVLTLPGRVLRLRRLGCRVDVVDGCLHLLPVPGLRTLELAWLNRPHRLMRWFAFNSMTVATRPQ
jgi:2-polyprenyl-3-methyl-5-hydroxy-6-metoxy-1,4-benzoquinol methylase